jgi:transposase
MANKPLKKALHMCALSAIRLKDDMRDYFDRKVKDGKNKIVSSSRILFLPCGWGSLS